MKILQTMVLLICLSAVHQAQSQAGGLTGYAGSVLSVDLVMPDGAYESPYHVVPVSGPTLEECVREYDDVIANLPAEEMFVEAGTEATASRECAPTLFYRSPHAPGGSMSPAARIWPDFPTPPVCITCLIFSDKLIVGKIFPDHFKQVNALAKQFKMDQYNEDLRALQNHYKEEMLGFEKAMFELEKETIGKGK